jgi:hypothetical protein
MLGGQHEDWLAARLEHLDHGDIDGICAAARTYPPGGTKDDSDKAMCYVENNAPHSRAASARAQPAAMCKVVSAGQTAG